MRWSFKIGRIAGTEIRVHLTLLLLLLWVAIASGAAAALSAVILLLLVFGCVLLHEMGHVLVALRFGIMTPKIVLYPIGGIAWMKKIPKDPGQELLVALAGPAVNIFLAALAFLLLGGIVPANRNFEGFSVGTFAVALLWINLVLGLFNLVPAFPMDGGRALRALLAMKLSYERATLIAVRIGEITGVGFAVFAVVSQNPVLFLIGLFLIFSASAEGSFVKREHLLEGLKAGDAAMSEFHTLRMQDSVHHAVSLILDGPQPDFPVVNEAGQCTAIATRDNIIRTLRDEGPNAPIADVVRQIPAQIDGEVPAAEAFRQLLESGLPGAAVVDKNGVLVRWLTSENVDDLIQMRSATHDFATV